MVDSASDTVPVIYLSNDDRYQAIAPSIRSVVEHDGRTREVRSHRAPLVSRTRLILCMAGVAVLPLLALVTDYV